MLIQLGSCVTVETPTEYSQVSQYMRVSEVLISSLSDSVVVGGLGIDVESVKKGYLAKGTAVLNDICGAFVVFIYDRKIDATFVCRDVLSAYSLFATTLDMRNCEGVSISSRPLSCDCAYFPPGHILKFDNGDIFVTETLRPAYPCPLIPISAISAEHILSDLLRSVVSEKLKGVESISLLFEKRDPASVILFNVMTDWIAESKGAVPQIGIVDWRSHAKTDGDHLCFDGRIHQGLPVFSPFLDVRVASLLFGISPSLSRRMYER